MSLVSKVLYLSTTHVAVTIDDRIREFEALRSKHNEDWFSELCFCILTANSSARLGIKIQDALGSEGFLKLPRNEIAKRLRELGHRFSERRAYFIAEARDFREIKDIITNLGEQKKAREWLVRTVMGLGYKEASHFLRNVGFDDVAILDRHVLRTMKDHGMIDEVPRGVARRAYMEFEGRLRALSHEVGMPLSKLDLYIWYMKTGAVLK